MGLKLRTTFYSRYRRVSSPSPTYPPLRTSDNSTSIKILFPFICSFLGLVAFFALGETALGWWAGFTSSGRSFYLHIFGRLAGVCAIFTWIWVGVLLSYNNQPGSTHTLTQTFVHIHTFTFFTALYIALGIALASQVPTECGGGYSDGLSGIWCVVSGSACAVAFYISILCGIAAVIIRMGSPSMKANICSGDIQVVETELITNA